MNEFFENELDVIHQAAIQPVLSYVKEGKKPIRDLAAYVNAYSRVIELCEDKVIYVKNLCSYAERQMQSVLDYRLISSRSKEGVLFLNHVTETINKIKPIYYSLLRIFNYIVFI